MTQLHNILEDPLGRILWIRLCDLANVYGDYSVDIANSFVRIEKSSLVVRFVDDTNTDDQFCFAWTSLEPVAAFCRTGLESFS